MLVSIPRDNWVATMQRRRLGTLLGTYLNFRWTIGNFVGNLFRFSLEDWELYHKALLETSLDILAKTLMIPKINFKDIPTEAA